MHWLPESPRVLILRNQREKAKETLQVIYRGATDDVIEFKLQVVEQYVQATTKLQSQYSLKERVAMYWTKKPYRRAIIAVSGVQAFGQLTGYNTLLYYSGTIFGLLGLKNSSAAGLIPSGGNAIFLFIGMTIVDRVGRRRLLVTVIPGMIIGLLWAAVSFHCEWTLQEVLCSS
jgi:SP family myo-inositol transporter-like MFS transporter 13